MCESEEERERERGEGEREGRRAGKREGERDCTSMKIIIASTNAVSCIKFYLVSTFRWCLGVVHLGLGFPLPL